MSRRQPENLFVSIHDRLLALARQAGEDFNFTLKRYANERFLYRLGCSPHRADFVLKGAMLLRLWGSEVSRPTRDIDLLGFGDNGQERLLRTFAEVAVVEVEPDGMIYQADALQLEAIREMDEYGGTRLIVPGYLGDIPLPVQIDVAFGDAITPEAVEATYPTLLDQPPPVLRMYPLETVVAEKLEAIVRFGMVNSRLKDYFDIWTLARTQAFDGQTMAEAIVNTFERRGTTIPGSLPTGLSAEFVNDGAKRRQWVSFIHRVGSGETIDLRTAADAIAAFVMPVVLAAANGERFSRSWESQGWR